MSFVWLLYAGGGLLGLVGTFFLSYTLYLVYIHWKYSEVPSPKMPSFYTGHLPDLMKFNKDINEDSSIGYAVEYWYEKVQSKTFVIFFFHIPTVLTLDPEVIKEMVMNVKNYKPRIFISAVYKVFGRRFMRNSLGMLPNYDSWIPRRQLYDPAFKRGYLKNLISTFNNKVNETLDEMKPLADGKTVVPLKKFIMQIAQKIISEAAFSADFSKIWTKETLGFKLPVDPGMTLFSYLITKAIEGLGFNLNTMFPSLNQYLYPKRAKVYQSCIDALRKIGRDCIMRRIKKIENGEEIPQDILSCMLSGSRELMHMEDMVDDFLNFYVGGQDTTANTIMFAVILLWMHPNTLEGLQKEVKDVLGDKTIVTNEDLEELQYTEQVFNEALRLYHPVIGQNKEIYSPLKVGNFSIPARTSVLALGANICRQAEHFDDPDAFNPDRFHPDNVKPDSFVFIPFGAGHRACIGKHFAMMEGKIVLARLVQTFNIRFPDDYTIQPVTRLITQPKDDLLCTITCRDL